MKIRDLAENEKSVRATRRHPKSIVCFCIENIAIPHAKCGRTLAKIDQHVKEFERQIGKTSLGEAGQVNNQLHDFLVTLVTQLFEAEAQAKKADKNEAQARAALLASVQAQCEGDILDTSTNAIIDALVGKGFNASRTLREHVRHWTDMIRSEYEGDTLRQAQLAKALAERLSATPDTGSEQQREDRLRKSIIGGIAKLLRHAQGGTHGPVHQPCARRISQCAYGVRSPNRRGLRLLRRTRQDASREARAPQ